ncbi:MAG: hypothetical protein ACI8R9_002438, partial [Paraglaciecola sp.]
MSLNSLKCSQNHLDFIFGGCPMKRGQERVIISKLKPN